MPSHIGIVACSAEGAALCYRSSPLPWLHIADAVADAAAARGFRRLLARAALRHAAAGVG